MTWIEAHQHPSTAALDAALGRPFSLPFQLDAGTGKGALAALADRVRFAGGNDVVVRLVVLQHSPHRFDEPDDYVIATGETHTVRECCERAFARAGIEVAEVEAI